MDAQWNNNFFPTGANGWKSTAICPYICSTLSRYLTTRLRWVTLHLVLNISTPLELFTVISNQYVLFGLLHYTSLAHSRVGQYTCGRRLLRTSLRFWSRRRTVRHVNFLGQCSRDREMDGTRTPNNRSWRWSEATHLNLQRCLRLRLSLLRGNWLLM